MVPTGVTTSDATLVDLLRRRAQQQPDRRAYTFLVDGEAQEATLTCADLDRAARAIGAWLQGHSAPGERALLLFHPGLEYIAAFFGCLYAGVVAVPAYPPRPNRPMPRIEAIVRDARASTVLTTRALQDEIEQRFEQQPQLRLLRYLATDSLAPEAADAWHPPAIGGEHVAFFQYTSGSTATPKGVMVSHRNLLVNSELIRCAFDHSPESRVLLWLPPYHDMGLIGGIVHPLYTGFPMLLMSPLLFLQRPLRWLDAIGRYGIQTSGGPNFAFELCIDKIRPEQRALLDLSSWRLAFNGAEPVRADTLARFNEAFGPCGFRPEAWYPCYGLAEATLFVTGGQVSALPAQIAIDTAALEQGRAAEPGDGPSRTLVSSGVPWLDGGVVIVDPTTALPCPEGQIGEVWVAGASVAQGYWNRPEDNTFQARLADGSAGPFLRTGDLGFLRAGELYVTGRIKDLIIVEGRNHYPQDIELTVERSHPAIRPGCVAAFAIEVNGVERLAVVAELDRQARPRGQQDEADAELAELPRALRQAIVQQHELQAHTVLLIKTGTLPKTSSGKVQRHACRAGLLAGTLEIWGGKREDVERQPAPPSKP
ncbi:MAG TPA: fatty acyl-AMP ligase [Roseiflexaceae bacterium]|nr:fatty acyl-AMP ligase [Roseiflexaceae bacterium]